MPKIEAPLLIHYVEDDSRINAMREGYEAALTANGKNFESHVYPGTKHGFYNNSIPRFNEAQAKIAWDRTVAFFKAHLA